MGERERESVCVCVCGVYVREREILSESIKTCMFWRANILEALFFNEKENENRSSLERLFREEYLPKTLILEHSNY